MTRCAIANLERQRDGVEVHARIGNRRHGVRIEHAKVEVKPRAAAFRSATCSIAGDRSETTIERSATMRAPVAAGAARCRPCPLPVDHVAPLVAGQQLGDAPLPQPVYAQAEQVAQHIVAPGDAFEDVVDRGLEMRGVAICPSAPRLACSTGNAPDRKPRPASASPRHRSPSAQRPAPRTRRAAPCWARRRGRCRGPGASR